MTPLVRYSFRFLVLLLAQYMLSQMPPLSGFITPYIYFAYIIWLPFNIKNNLLLVIAAILGLVISYLLGTPGIHGAVCVLLAFVRPYLLQTLLVKDAKEQTYAEPSIYSMGITPYITYAAILTILHYAYLVILQWMSVGNFGFFFLKLFLSSAISILLILLLEMVFPRRLKTRASLR
jgi:hypothetical protein